MAIIRSRRLFARTVSNLEEGEDPRFTATVYTCPPGFRAIFRSITAVLFAIPSTQNSTYHVDLQQSSGGELVQVHWHSFIRAVSPTVAEWNLADTWSTMLVLHGGDQLVFVNNSAQGMNAQGSGHLLPEVQ